MSKKIVFIVILLTLIIPLAQRYLKFVKLQPLDGAYTNTNVNDLNLRSWINESFQKSVDQNVKDSIGFKPFLVRLNNEIAYRMFSFAANKGCVVGKNQNLFLESYINGYIGNNYKDEEVIIQKVDNLKKIQTYFESLGKTFFIILSPGKASFYSEDIPDRYQIQKQSLTDLYSKLFKKEDINYINLNNYFKSIKDTCPIPLYPKNGVHWSSYGMAISMDSIIKTIEHYRKTKLPSLELVRPIKFSPDLNTPDYDVEANMNLMFELNREPMPYPEYVYKQKDRQALNSMMISDSYYWQAYGQNIPQNIFTKSSFWFYFNTLYPEVDGNARSTENVKIMNELLDQDVIMLMGTEATMHMFPYEFDKTMIKLLESFNFNTIKDDFISKINADSAWKALVIHKATKNNLSVEEQIMLDAKFMTRNEILEKEPFWRDFKDPLQEKIDEIKSNEEWYKSIKEKAKNNDIDIDKQLELDAKWMIENQ